MTNVIVYNLENEWEFVSLPVSSDYTQDGFDNFKLCENTIVNGIWTGESTKRRFGKYTETQINNDGKFLGEEIRYVELDTSDYLLWCSIVSIEPKCIEPTVV